MTFQRPELIGLIPAMLFVVSVAILGYWRRGVRLVDAYGGRQAAFRLIGRRVDLFPSLRLVSTFLGVALLGSVFSGIAPVQPEEAPVTPVDLLIAVDVSQSMTGNDIEPSRIAWAQRLVEDIIGAGVADRVGLSIFADWSYHLVPLTDDSDVVSFFSPWVVPSLVSARDQGTSLGVLIEDAIEEWERRSRPDTSPVVLVVSDGEAHDSQDMVIKSTQSAVESGATIWTAGIGTVSGAALTLTGSTAPLLDGSGLPVVAGYDEELLRQIADVGRGAFHQIEDEASIRSLIADLRSVSGRTETIEEPASDPTVWLLLIGLALLVFEALLDAGLTTRRAP